VLIQAPVDDETCACNNCPYMKLNTLEKIKKTMIEKLNPISINAQVQERAKLPLQRMVDIVNGKPVQFSDRFM
jgi:quinolinate synthase